MRYTNTYSRRVDLSTIFSDHSAKSPTALDEYCMLSYLRYRSALHHLLLIALLVISGTKAWAKDDSPQVLMSAVYEGKISGWNVELERTLTQYPDGHYRLRSYASKLFASIEETSTFILEDGHILPQEYVYKRSVFGNKSVERIVYDWDKGQAKYTRSDRKQNNTEHTLKPNLLDPALYQLALQADLAKGHDGLHYRFIKRKRIEQYHLKTMANETTHLAGKKYDATVVLREDPDSDKTTKVWVAPALNHVITKIQHTDKGGDEFEITLTKLSVNEKALNKFYRAFSNNDKTK